MARTWVQRAPLTPSPAPSPSQTQPYQQPGRATSTEQMHSSTRQLRPTTFPNNPTAPTHPAPIDSGYSDDNFPPRRQTFASNLAEQLLLRRATVPSRFQIQAPISGA